MLLAERHADALCFAPDDVAGHVQPIGGEHQGKLFGDTKRLVTSSAAPDRLRTIQLIAPPSNSIVPAFKTRFLGTARCSSVYSKYAKILMN
jgi:hypothetical protein